MASGGRESPTDPKAYFEAVSRKSTQRLTELSDLPTQINEKNVKYNSSHIDTCKDIHAFVQGIGNELRRQGEERRQALRAQLNRSCATGNEQPRETPSPYEKLHGILKSTSNNVEKVDEDLLRRGGSKHVIQLRANLEALRDEANLLVAKATHASSMKLREHHALDIAETKPQNPLGSNMFHTTRPPTPLDMSLVTQQTILRTPEHNEAASMREEDEEDPYDKAKRECGFDLLPIQRSRFEELLSDRRTTKEHCSWLRNTLQDRR